MKRIIIGMSEQEFGYYRYPYDSNGKSNPIYDCDGKELRRDEIEFNNKDYVCIAVDTNCEPELETLTAGKIVGRTMTALNRPVPSPSIDESPSQYAKRLFDYARENCKIISGLS